MTTVSLKPTPPGVQLVLMPQLAEATSREDDWTGTSNAAARRRAQTRLNTRAYRKRKALAKKLQVSQAVINTPARSEAQIECWDIAQNSVLVVPASRAQQLYDARRPLLANKYRPGPFLQVFFPLCPDHLITLLQLNALRALIVNRELISSILTTPFECDGETMRVTPCPAHGNSSLLPPALLPTVLQQTVPHGDWIDVFPCAAARDRLIKAAGTFDENELWADCIGGLYEGFPDNEMERRGFIAWSPPWDISGWEMSKGFFQKWGWLVEGLPDVLEATNSWRRERGEGSLCNKRVTLDTIG